MPNRKSAIMFCLLFFISLQTHASQLTPEQSSAKTKGITLYNQHKAISAESYLEIAAAAGDIDAQYYLAEALRFNNRYTTQEAYKWYTAAAEQGDMYAMRRLSLIEDDLCIAMGNCPTGLKSPSDWLKQLTTTARPLAENGNGEAMYIMFHATEDLDWLEKSADSGYAYGQYWLAALYEEGRGFFLLPWERREKVKELVRKSAEGGYAVGMAWHASNLAAENKLKKARYWLKKGAETGFTSAFYRYSAYQADPDNQFKMPVNLVESYGLMSLLLELNGGGEMLTLAKVKLPQIAAKMTPEQIEQAKVFAKKWKATHPPLSYFPEKLGF